MKTDWDYTTLADAYLKRPDYSTTAVDALLSVSAIKGGASVCDVGAGVAHLTLMLAAKNLEVSAVEPNDAMRAHGIARTADYPLVSWFEGTGESTGQKTQSFDLVTFGSSFNVCDRQLALREVSRILKPEGWFACLWNHRSLTDPVQCEIEAIIKKRVPGYGYGSRREDQTPIIDGSGLFGDVLHLDSTILHRQTVDECVEAWRSHATLARQAGSEFGNVISEIQVFLRNLDQQLIVIPYLTNVWIAQLR